MDQPGKPIAWLNASSSPTGAAHAHASLRTVLGYVHAEIIDTACVHIPVPRQAVGPDGLISDAGIRRRIADALGHLAGAVRATPSSPTL